MATCSSCGADLEDLATHTCPAQSDESSLEIEGDGTPVRINDVIDGKWKVLRKLGAGGMGTVVLAEDVALHRQVAVKLLARHLCRDAKAVERFEREARFTATLEHPNIVPVYAVGETGGRPYLVMKHLAGKPLTDLLRRSAPKLELDRVLRLLEQAAKALDFVHSRGLVHRDVKPPNLFVGPGDHLTVLDFGIMRDLTASSATTEGVLLGTVAYIAPEQLRGSAAIDFHADIYALAVVACQMLTGATPFVGASDVAILTEKITGQLAFPTSSQLPVSVSAVLRRALSSTPDHRHASAGELVDDLRRAYETPPAPSPSPARAFASEGTTVIELAPAASGPMWRKRWVGVAAALGALLVLVVGWSLRSHFAPDASMGVAAGFTGASGNPSGASSSPSGASGNPSGASGNPSSASPDPTGASPDPSGASPDPTGASASAATPNAPPKVPSPASKRPKRPHVETRIAPALGTLRVLTAEQGKSTWAQISVDGQARGGTPLQLQLSAGRHRVRIERTGFRTEERDVTVVGGQQVVVSFDLVR